MLEEINYFDGDASAVTAGLTNNVDVTKMSFFMIYLIQPPEKPFFKFISHNWDPSFDLQELQGAKLSQQPN